MLGGLFVSVFSKSNRKYMDGQLLHGWYSGLDYHLATCYCTSCRFYSHTETDFVYSRIIFIKSGCLCKQFHDFENPSDTNTLYLRAQKSDLCSYNSNIVLFMSLLK